MILSRAFRFIHSRSGGLASRGRNLYYRCLGVHITGYIWMRAIEIPRDPHNIRLDCCSLERDVTLLCIGPTVEGVKISIGRGSYINRRTFIDASQSVAIGEDVAVGPDCYITDHDHGLDPRLTPLGQGLLSKPTRICDRVWLGAHVVVLKGVTIGERTVVGAGSVVTKDLPADAIAVGVPARVVRYRTVDGIDPILQQIPKPN